MQLPFLCSTCIYLPGCTRPYTRAHLKSCHLYISKTACMECNIENCFQLRNSWSMHAFPVLIVISPLRVLWNLKIHRASGTARRHFVPWSDSPAQAGTHESATTDTSKQKQSEQTSWRCTSQASTEPMSFQRNSGTFCCIRLMEYLCSAFVGASFFFVS